MNGPEEAIRLLGLAARAGAVVAGTERVREAAARGRLRLVIVASDVSPNRRQKLMPLLERAGVRIAPGTDRARLGEAVGRAPVSAIGVTDASFARRIEELL